MSKQLSRIKLWVMYLRVVFLLVNVSNLTESHCNANPTCRAVLHTTKLCTASYAFNQSIDVHHPQQERLNSCHHTPSTKDSGIHHTQQQPTNTRHHTLSIEGLLLIDFISLLVVMLGRPALTQCLMIHGCFWTRSSGNRFSGSTTRRLLIKSMASGDT